MIRFLGLHEVVELHRRIVETSGGSPLIRDLGLLDSALAQPKMTFAGQDLYPTIVEKAAALGYSLICNHPFVDGNKRIGHAAMESFLMLNGSEIDCHVDEQERIILAVAAGEMGREQFTEWLTRHVRP